jgi:hypothetical protein
MNWNSSQPSFSGSDRSSSFDNSVDGDDKLSDDFLPNTDKIFWMLWTCSRVQ